MKRVIRKAILFGMGVTTLSKEKIEKFVKELEKEGELSGEEGKKLIKELVRDVDKKQKELSKNMKRHARGIIKKSPLATKSDIKKLEKKMKDAYNDVRDTAKKYKVSLRMAAYIIGVSRVAKTMKIRGLYI